jgi:hypothetical protein
MNDCSNQPAIRQPERCQGGGGAILAAAWHVLSRNERFKPAPRSTAGALSGTRPLVRELLERPIATR